MPAITGKTVVVVGGSRGIGAEFVQQFVAKGNRVIAGCRDPTQAKELQGLENVSLTQVDISNPQSVEQWAEAVQQLTPHIDYVINNAGIYSRLAGLEDVTAADMLADFTTNCIGPLLAVQQLHKRGLLGGKQPTVVASVSSKMASVEDNTSGGHYSYRASKAALNIVNTSLSADLAGHNVVCTLLHPGFVRTDLSGGVGTINRDESVSGMISVLESKELQGTWHDYAGNVVPW